jgi:cytochrome c oxidase assembly protein subunit 15
LDKRSNQEIVKVTPWLARISLISILLALCVVVLGAYTRLSDAGLGCPDWPGCYGQIIAPYTSDTISKANQAYPLMPVDVAKAFTEMTHRYFAELLGSLIVAFAALAYWKRKSLTLPLWLPLLLVALVIAQGLLGMWTVTLRLFPIIVLLHLIGGFTTLSLLWLCWLNLKLPNVPNFSFSTFVPKLALFTLVILVLQIMLGGWTSANYAALICPDFPKCQGVWFPEFHFKMGFDLLTGLGSDTPLNHMHYQGKTTIHMVHRIGAMVTLFFGFILTVALHKTAKAITNANARRWLMAASHSFGFLLFVQLCLGVSNVMFFLPLPVAVAHNGIAALLLLSLITINFILCKAKNHD